jgi:hypothetical protein
MTFTRAKPGNWATGERLTSAQANHGDAQWPHAIDGNEGGSYAPSAAITIGGEGLRVDEATVDGMPVRKQEHDAGLASKVTAGSARYSIGTGAGATVTLTEVFADAGYALHDGTHVQVPAPGRYYCSAQMSIVSSSTSGSGAVRLDGTIKLDSTIHGYDHHRRYSSDADHSGHVCPTALVDITDPETQRINCGIGTNSGTASVSSSSAMQLSIVRVSS